ncbi:MAG TPA: dephospho-CoA kinase [Burkholderiales bacterium]|nr:dephospho-CoA kinase [Burkholderiales bacterium]
MPYCVGLTGGIGSGKTTAADMFAALGAAVVDTDAIARELTAPGGAAMAAIRAAFGAQFAAADGGLDRAKMRRLVFGDAAARSKLEAILHPRIREKARAAIAASRAPYVIVVVPLLLETGAYRDLVRRVLVVDCSEERQIERAVRRGGLTEEEARAIIAAQLPRAARLARADDVLDNEGEIEALRRQVARLHEQYLGLARGR